MTDRLCWGILGAAMAIAAALILYLGRGTIFYSDELTLFYRSPELGLADLLEPINGHLVGIPQLTMKVVLEVFGADYLVLRVLHVLALVSAVALFYALIKPRIGAVAALAPTLVLLFFGSAGAHVVSPIGFGIFVCIGAGLGALLSLERDDRRGDAAACGLLVLSIATFTTGLAFLVGVGVAVMLREDRWRRAWIFLVPLALYTAWWVWAQGSAEPTEEQVTISNALLIPAFSADSAAAVLAALTGLNYDFGAQPTPQLEWGQVLAVIAVVALGLRIRRGDVPRSLWVSLGIVLAFWALGAMAFSFLRPPGIDRYMYMGAVGVLLVATDAARSVRFTRFGLVALFAVCAVGLATNVSWMRHAAGFLRTEYSAQVRASFAMLELARDRVGPGFDPLEGMRVSTVIATSPGTYFPAVDRYGSPAFSLAELERQPEGVRQTADRVLATALRLDLAPAPSGTPTRGCTRVPAPPRGGVRFELPRGGATLRGRLAAPGEVTVGRFADAASVSVGRLAPGETAILRIPPDASPRLWRISIQGASSVRVCPLS